MEIRLVAQLFLRRQYTAVLARQLCHLQCFSQTTGKRELGSSCTTSPDPSLTNTHNNKSWSSLPGFVGLEPFRDKIAISSQNVDYTYGDLYLGSWELAQGLLGMLGSESADIEQAKTRKIGILCDTGLSHVMTTWACWMIGCAVVPLPLGQTKTNLEGLVRESGASVLISSKSQADLLQSVAKSISNHCLHVALDDSWWSIATDEETDGKPLPNPFVDNSRFKNEPALVLYTGGRGGSPTRLNISHQTLNMQIESVANSWDLTEDDTVLHSLNLHQTYSLICALHSPLQMRARIVSVPQCQLEQVWSHLLAVNKPPVTVFPATPVIYNNLLEKARELFKDKKTKEYVKSVCTKKVRLMTSGCSNLSVTTSNQWKNITGHSIMNNYVSSRLGIIFSSKCSPQETSRGCSPEGYTPLPGIHIRLVRFRDHTKTNYDICLEDNSEKVSVFEADSSIDADATTIGELLVKDTKNSGSSSACETWYPTGDIVQYKLGSYKLRGKLKVKSILVDGEAVSLQEVEKKLVSNPDIVDALVIGIVGEQNVASLAALVIVNKNSKLDANSIINWCSDNMQPVRIPKVLKLVDSLPRDSSGHVDKLRILAMFPAANTTISFHDSKL